MRWTATDLGGRDFEKSHASGSDKETVTPTIHLTLQGKGGVGKSLVASILAQYFRHRGAEIHCLDTDPVNHELAHEMLHHKKDGPPVTKLVRETQAEAVAFVVCRGVGLETNTAAADYIALYNGDKKTLAESLAVIQETSAKILNDLFPEQRLAPSRRASTAPNPTEREQAQPNRITQHEQTISLDR